MGAALDMLKKGKEKKPAPPEDDKAGAEYSKVGDVVGDHDYDDDGDEGEAVPLDDDVHEDAASFDSLADHLGIPDESREGAKAALKSYVKACMREHNSSDK